MKTKHLLQIDPISCNENESQSITEETSSFLSTTQNSQGTSYKVEKISFKGEPLPKQPRRMLRNSISTLSEFSTIIPNCKAEIKELNNDEFIVMDEQFGNNLLDWQKCNQPVYSSSDIPSNFNSNSTGKIIKFYLFFFSNKLLTKTLLFLPGGYSISPGSLTLFLEKSWFCF